MKIIWWGVLEEAAAIIRAEIAEEALVLDGNDGGLERLNAALAR